MKLFGPELLFAESNLWGFFFNYKPSLTISDPSVWTVYYWFMLGRLYVSIYFSIFSGCLTFLAYDRLQHSLMIIFLVSLWYHLLFVLFHFLFVCILSFLLSSHLSLYGYFLQPWLYQSFSVSLQFAFSKNCSTWRSIFDVFVGGGELCILLPHHHDLLPIYILILSNWERAESFSFIFCLIILMPKWHILQWHILLSLIILYPIHL